MDEIDRIKLIRASLGMTAVKFGEKMGYSNGASYENIENRTKKFSSICLQRLVKAYNVNNNYVLTGEGSMFTDKPDNKRDNTAGAIYSNDTIPYYDIEISAGPITFYQDYKEMPSQKIEIPFIKDVDLAMPVYGDSMYPKIKNGDIVLLKEVDKGLIMYGEIYLVITNDYRVLKYVRKHQSIDSVVLLSENDRFDPVEITKDEIIHIFLYKGKFEKSQI